MSQLSNVSDTMDQITRSRFESLSPERKKRKVFAMSRDKKKT